MDLASLGPDSRLKDPALGAGSLLDIGIYPMTSALLTLDAHVGEQVRRPKIAAVQTTRDGIDVASSMLLIYSSGAEQATLRRPPRPRRSKGSVGSRGLEGTSKCKVSSFSIYPKNVMSDKGLEERSVDGPIPSIWSVEGISQTGQRLYHEADAVALDIAAA
jgi:hypothetical protein